MDTHSESTPDPAAKIPWNPRSASLEMELHMEGEHSPYEKRPLELANTQPTSAHAVELEPVQYFLLYFYFSLLNTSSLLAYPSSYNP